MKADLGDVTLRYEVAGEGPDLLLSHGVIENSSSWDDVLAPLAGLFRVTCYDARGRGEEQSGPRLGATGQSRNRIPRRV